LAKQVSIQVPSFLKIFQKKILHLSRIEFLCLSQENGICHQKS